MNDKTTKVIRFHEAGNASVLKVEELPVSEPGADELRIKVEAIGLNRAEVMFREGAYLEAPEFPSRLGYEAAGVVEAVGDNVDGFKVGDKVSTVPAFSMGQYGVYAEIIVVPVHAVAHYPSSFSAQQATAIWMPYLTAYGALIKIADVSKGQFVLVTAASSSVGIAAIEIAKSQGATVIATTRGPSKKQFLRDKGADHVIETESEDLVARVMEITAGAGINVTFDPIGGPIVSQLAEAASQGGTIIEYGALDSAATPYPLFSALAKGLTIRGYTIFEITQNPERLSRAKDFLFSFFESEKTQPTIDKVFDFSEIHKAHEYLESNQQMGKIVINVALSEG